MTSPPVRVVGSFFRPIGISRVARVSLASFRAAGIDAKAFDLWGEPPSSQVDSWPAAHRSSDLGTFNLFHLNGDEIETALAKLGGLPTHARNVICPMWELPHFPEAWARQVERFDEVWAASRFIYDAIEPAVSIPVVHMPLATEAFPTNLRSRRYFNIPEETYALLFFFDMRSYAQRKNPVAVLEAFKRLIVDRPWAPVSLVLKVHGYAHHNGESAAELEREIGQASERIVRIDGQMPEDDVRALVYNCDAFVSLHRAEGYGLGLAEAMSVGRPVVGTAYSGNMDFMADDVAHLVSYRLVPVPRDAYPHWQDQVWADPDVDDAASHLRGLVDDPEAGRRLGRLAAQRMAAKFSYRAAGLRYAARLADLAG
jgi:glycosyltransferase involved in cell wall biosynthesis